MASPDEGALVRAPYTVIGYHGCDARVAERLLDGEPFRLSENEYDWLGDGAYYWEYAPFRAYEWARELHGDNRAVLKAEIVLGTCLNLLDTTHFTGLQRAYADVAQAFASSGARMPANRRGRNRLDRLVVNELCDSLAAEQVYFDTVRGCFPEGVPLFEGSQLLSQTHVQIAVRNPSCIGALELVKFD